MTSQTQQFTAEERRFHDQLVRDENMALVYNHIQRTTCREIPIEHMHTCDGVCPDLVDCKDGGKHFEDRKCNKNGETEGTSIHIASYNPDHDWRVPISERSNRRSPLINGDEIVISDSRISIEFVYPMRNKATIEFSSPGGFSRAHIIDSIVALYRRIYEEEEKTIREKPVIPEDARGRCRNRNETDGKYGIYSHDIGDLWIEGIYYNAAARTVTMSIGS